LGGESALALVQVPQGKGLFGGFSGPLAMVCMDFHSVPAKENEKFTVFFTDNITIESLLNVFFRNVLCYEIEVDISRNLLKCKSDSEKNHT